MDILVFLRKSAIVLCCLFSITIQAYNAVNSKLILLFYTVNDDFSISWDIFQYHKSCWPPTTPQKRAISLTIIKFYYLIPHVGFLFSIKAKFNIQTPSANLLYQ